MCWKLNSTGTEDLWVCLLHCLKALDTIGNCQITSLLTGCISTYAQNNKPVKICAHSVVEVAR